jgi:tetratricopeptide (TPR) repeat protein
MAICAISVVRAQDDLVARFKQLYYQQKYDEIINYKTKKSADLPAKAIYYKAMSYYMKSEDANAMKYMDMAIAKGPVDYDMFFYKGMLLFYADRVAESLPYYDRAIALLPDEPDYYAGKGEAYYKLARKDSALTCLEHASHLPRCKPRVYMMIGELYQERRDNEKSLSAYKMAYDRMTPADADFQDCSFNLGLSQQLTGKVSEARATFENLVSSYPTDYHAVAKLIQIYYALSEFDKAVPYKEKLYAAHRANKLPEEMRDMFCFDQFIWQGKRVMAFENFQETGDFLTVKHHFYVMLDNGEIDYRIDSESSPALRMNGSKGKYVLCLVRGNSHFTYWQYVFGDDYKYVELKSAVLDILNGKVQPAASFIPGQSSH